MTTSTYIKVFTGDFISVQRMFLELENENICAIIKDESESERMAGIDSFIQGFQEIHVHNEELEKAILVVESITSELETQHSKFHF